MRPSQNLPLPSRYNLFSTNVYVRPPPPLTESTPPSKNMPPFQQLYAILPESTPPSKIYHLFNKCICATPPPPLTESTPPSKNMPPFNNYMRSYQNLPLPLGIYTPPPPFQQYPPFQQLYATLPESTLPSQNIPPFSTNVYLRPSKNLLVPPRIYPPPLSTPIYDSFW